MAAFLPFLIGAALGAGKTALDPKQRGNWQDYLINAGTGAAMGGMGGAGVGADAAGLGADGLGADGLAGGAAGGSTDGLDLTGLQNGDFSAGIHATGSGPFYDDAHIFSGLGNMGGNVIEGLGRLGGGFLSSLKNNQDKQNKQNGLYAQPPMLGPQALPNLSLSPYQANPSAPFSGGFNNGRY